MLYPMLQVDIHESVYTRSNDRSPQISEQYTPRIITPSFAAIFGYDGRDGLNQ